jgi:hypothetical protein
MVLRNVQVRNAIVNLGNKFIQSIKEDCGSNVTLNLPTVKGDNVRIYLLTNCISYYMRDIRLDIDSNLASGSFSL